MSLIQPPDEPIEIDWAELGRVFNRLSACTDITIAGYDESICRQIGPFRQTQLARWLDWRGGWDDDGFCSKIEAELVRRCITSGVYEEVAVTASIQIASLPICIKDRRCGAIVFGWVVSTSPSEQQAGLLAHELSVTTKDVWQLMRCSPLIAQAKFSAISGMVETVINSITSQSESRARVERLIRVRELFLATVSHELRTPLSSISYRLQALSSALLSDPGQVKRAYTAMTKNVKDLARITEDLADAARSETGQLTIAPEIIAVSAPVMAAIDAVQATALMDEISIHILSKEPIEQALINGDRSRLQQVFWNLLVNAIRFTPSGGEILVELKLLDRFVVVDISDTGVGIDHEDLNQVFSPFYRRTIGNQSGLGLGLTISNELVKQHGGRVTIDSAGPGQGTRVSVSLPRLLGQS